MSDDKPADTPDKVVVLTLTARRPADAPLVLVGGTPVPAERVSFELVDDGPDDFEQLLASGRPPDEVTRNPRHMAVLTLTARPELVSTHPSELAIVRYRPARPHSTALLGGDDAYAHADPTVPLSLTTERTPDGVCLSIHTPHSAHRFEVAASEVHTLAAELVAVLSREPDRG